ncbi:MerR family transcriptional regulator [Pseudomonas sp. NPDC090202]|uniref:MerR family transcriptional regulator n=1 Tax=unclassified Pseudomonas TaxID=196821 RepID=UPI0037F8A4E6
MSSLLHDPQVGDGPHPEELFPIREVARLTGVNPVTLRAWERRYGLIVPTRTDSGHRLYSQADIDTVRSIMGWIARGVAVSKVGRILASARQQPQAVAGVSDATECAGWQQRLRQAVNDFDEQRLDQLYGQVFSMYPLPVVFEDVLMPVWREFAVSHDSRGQTSEWLFFDCFLRVRVMQRLQLTRISVDQRVVLAALPGGCRELELWVAGVMLAAAGVAVSVLAPGQALEELSHVCTRMQPQALVLFANQVPSSELPKRLRRLGLELSCPLLLAGETADLAQDSLAGSPIACLGGQGLVMQRRLQQFLAGSLDT